MNFLGILALIAPVLCPTCCSPAGFHNASAASVETFPMHLALARTEDIRRPNDATLDKAHR